ncbi:membrane protein insertase YidC [Angustibacter peucedani]
MGKILYPLEYAVAWIMVHFHSLLSTLGLPEESGWTWALSIVGLVVVIRIILIPLFVKQIKASRGMQLIQPQMQAIQKKYKGKTDPESRQAMTQETMALYKESGTNPLASCLPILLQAPIFFALFRVLNQYVRHSQEIGPLTKALATQADNSTIFGATLSSTFMSSTDANVKIITVVLIILMSATTFTTQRQLMMKNMPAAALDNPFAKQQKLLLYVLPLVFAVSGVNFPIGVLLYWLTTNLWSMGQQFYVIRRMPAPGSPAEKAMLERKKRHGKGGDAAIAGPQDTPPDDAPVAGQRQQPKRQARGKRGGRPGTAGPNPSGPQDTPPPSKPAGQTTGTPKGGQRTGQGKKAPKSGA